MVMSIFLLSLMPFGDGLNCAPPSLETASVILNHIGRFGSPDVIHTDQGPAFHNELVQELLRLQFFCHSVFKRGERHRGAC